MNPTEFFIRRPVATTLLTLGLTLAGAVAFFRLPVAPLPQVDFPTIVVEASMPGASPEVMAATVATPLERHLGTIADVSEMTSQTTVGSTRVVLQFGLDRDIDGAARDVQAAINAARADLPANLHSNPTYRKSNPADAPILILALTSSTLTRGQLYDAATTVLQQRLSQLPGIGEVDVSGSSLPAVRVELNPRALFKYGIGLEDVRAALSAANAHSPKGAIEQGDLRYQIYTNDQASDAAQYRSLVVAYRNGAAVRLSDVGEVQDSVENLRNAGLANGKPAILVILYKQPGANIISAVDAVKEALPQLKASIAKDIDITVANDRSVSIRGSLHDVEVTLLISVALVILVVFAFLGNARAAIIPTVAVPVSLIGTFSVMYLLGYSIDNLSLMALTVATGFVVDDAIVVLENISRHVEAGMSRFEAAILGAREVSFTVISMSLSLIAVFLPILLMGGIVGRIFREFALTLSIAIMVSLVVPLSATPMMCARLLTPAGEHRPGRLARALGGGFEAAARGLPAEPRLGAQNSLLVLGVLIATLFLNVYLFTIVPKGFFPQQDQGRLIGGIRADQSISFQLMSKKMTQFINILMKDPAVGSVVGFTGGGQTNSGFVFMELKPLAQRKLTTDQVITRLRRELQAVTGAQLFLQSVQDIRIGGRQSNAQYQYTLQSDNLEDLHEWTPKLAEALRHVSELTDVDSDQQQGGLETEVTIDRQTAQRLGISTSQIDNTLYDAFGQRQVSTIYNPLNQYHVVMEVAPAFWESPDTLNDLYVSTSGGAVSGVQATNAVVGTTTASTAAANTSTAAAAIANDAARNQATNSIASTGKGSASTGSAVTTRAETMIPLSAFAHFAPGSTRWRSTIRGSSPPAPSPSIWPRASPSAPGSPPSTAPWSRSASPAPSTAPSRARRRSSSNPSPASRS